jgi:FAD binding domain
MRDIEVPVLIVGGSLVGMPAAMFLGHHGIRATVVEHHRGAAIHPRAAMITQRTMETFRTVGIESGFLVVNTTGDPALPNQGLWSGLTNDRCIEFLRSALGDDSIPLQIDDVMKWNARADVAARFRDGSIFLAGDAAHVMPPYGGYGGNVGVQDAHALAWKLAYVLGGWAGEELLATYEPERRPASALTTEQAYTRYVTREAKYLNRGDLEAHVDDLNIEMGYLYDSSAVVPETGADNHRQENPRESRGRPGSRAPHLWLEPEKSTLDLFDRNFALLIGFEGERWLESARSAAQQLSISLDVHRIAQPSSCEAYGISATGAVLVRPDGFVAWRAHSVTSSCESSLVQALSAVLHRSLSWTLPSDAIRLTAEKPNHFV